MVSLKLTNTSAIRPDSCELTSTLTTASTVPLAFTKVEMLPRSTGAVRKASGELPWLYVQPRPAASVLSRMAVAANRMGLSPPLVPLHGALSTLCSVASRLERVTEPRALQGYGICAQATSYWETAAVEFAFAADAVPGFPA